MAMTNNDLKELASFSRLPEGQLFVRHVKMRLAEADARLRTARGEDVFRAQGASHALADLAAEIEQAEVRLQRAVGSRP
jgi:hypothetical protein